MDIKKIIEATNIDVEAIADPAVKDIVAKLLNVIELLAHENENLREENQKLRDENNRLKGEQGKPNIRKQTKKNQSHSSENERKNKKNKKKNKSKKKGLIKIARTEVCTLDKDELPPDAIFKGYKDVIVQDIVIKTENIKFQKATYYSPSLKQSFMASLPEGYDGKFGPNIKALVLDMHHNHKTTESALVEFFRNHGIDISVATISRFITENQEVFHQEKEEIVVAGLASSTYQQMDDTGARVKGKNNYTHILCNEFYTAYFTRPKKDRLTIIDILTQGEMNFQFNELSYALMEQMHLSSKTLNRLKESSLPECMNREQVDALLKKMFPNDNKHSTSRRIILEASAIVSYQSLPTAIQILLTDDAPQFKLITELLALCWVHDGRHYKKLNPIIYRHKEILNKFLDKYWVYYHRLLDYKENPTTSMEQSLLAEFDSLFSTETGYELLDERIKKTKLKKEALLLLLKFPDVPAHNNGSELSARKQARYRDISYHTMSEAGTKAKDTGMTIVETAKKLGINSYQYFRDRITKSFTFPSLASLIETKSQNTICGAI